MQEESTGRRPTRVVLLAVALFAVAVFLARLLLAGGAAWVAFLVIVPLLLFVLTAAVGFRIALAGSLVFSLAVLALREFLERVPSGWVALVLLPVVAFTAVLVGRVLARMKRDRDAAKAARDEAPAQE